MTPQKINPKIIHEFENNVKCEVTGAKRETKRPEKMGFWGERADYEGILSITDNKKK